MDAPDVSRAIEATIAIAVGLGLPADEAIVLNSSNKLALRLLPCDVFARVAHRGHGNTQFEVELAQRLAEAGSPVAALEPRVAPRGYERDAFELTLWTYYATVTPHIAAADCASALGRLHAGMRTIDVATPHFTERVADPDGNIASTPVLDDVERKLLTDTLRDLGDSVAGSGADEQLLHGEPHPGNVLGTELGPVFIDLETCCRGPVEFDLAHMSHKISEHYPGVDHALLEDCRGLVLAMVAKHRCDPGDQFPNGEQALRDLLVAVREGPPWPTLGELMGGGS